MAEKKSKIPESRISGSGFLNIEWKKGEEGEVLFFNGWDILLGKNKFPIMLFTSPTIASLEIFNVGDRIFKIKKLVLNSLFGKEPNTDLVYGVIPEWLTKMKCVEEISFENMEIENLEVVAALPLKCIYFKNVIVEDSLKTIDLINNLQELEEVYYDDTFRPLIDMLDRRIRCINLE